MKNNTFSMLDENGKEVIYNVLFTFETIRELFVYNLCAVLVYGIILTVFVYAKNK